MQHNETISKLKLETYVDRQQYLRSLIRIEDETVTKEVAKEDI